MKGYHSWSDQWSMYAKHEVAISSGSKVIAKVKVHNRHTGQKQ